MAFLWLNNQNTTFFSNTTSVNAGVTNAANAHGTLTNGDLLVAVIAVQTGGATDPGTITGPVGWTQAFQTGPTAGSSIRLAAFTHVYAGEAYGYTFSWTNAGQYSWMIFDYGALSLDVGGGNSGQLGGASSVVANAISPTGSADVLLALWFITSVSNTIWSGFPAGETTRATIAVNATSDTFAAADETLSASGSTGTKTVTLTSGQFKDFAAGLVSLKAAAATAIFTPRSRRVRTLQIPQLIYH